MGRKFPNSPTFDSVARTLGAKREVIAVSSGSQLKGDDDAWKELENDTHQGAEQHGPHVVTESAKRTSDLCAAIDGCKSKLYKKRSAAR